jgi:DNA repair protein RecN (Recombination protein N)
LIDEKGISEVLNEARHFYDEAASKLSLKRKESALELNNIITDKLKDLSFTHGKFEVNLKSIEPSANGNEQVEFLISTYLNAEPRPIQKVASGGELSRISLAIRVASIKKANVPVMIFDEVDVGIGGGVAEVVGKLLKDLADDAQHQIFAITHLPQVAAQSLNHFKVSKEQINGETVSQIHLLDESGRVNELARMLGGVEITNTTIEHAKELLS